MDPVQAFSIPAPGDKPRGSDYGWLLTYSLRGLAELVRARLVFARLQASEILVRNRIAIQAPARGDEQSAATVVARIGYVLPRISTRLPWRSDCLIQAIAAQNWLAALGLASEIRIGIARPEDGGLSGHAWLVHEGNVVTGGTVEQYHVLLGGTLAKGREPDPAVDRHTAQRTSTKVGSDCSHVETICTNDPI